MVNRLIDETSPYLVQHAHNPVDWYPWGEEALARAQREDRPILLSIGYAACHWCHVMERESFENEETARIMNENFISIKVDREERPDLDAIYMQAVQALTGHGGWPMTVFLTPNGEPFYGGTYFPPEDRLGMPGFPRLLKTMAEAYRTKRSDVTQAATQIVARLQQSSKVRPSLDLLNREILHQATQNLEANFDEQNGGFGAAPKFPQPMTYDFLLHFHHASNGVRALKMVEITLEKMARGGMYDQLGGGFHRYSTDGYWLVPHFEKMLYDNALLSRLYLHAYQVTGRDFYRRITEETLDYVLREMTNGDGGFYSTQDADSEGVEGKFFLWTPQEVEEALGKEDAVLFNAYYGVTPQGNFEGENILHVPREASMVAAEMGVEVERLEAAIQRGKEILLKVRNQRVYPGRDEKILTAWNGLMLRSFAEAAAVLRRGDYRKAAIANASLITQVLQRDGRLLRTYKDGQAKLKGYLEDYSFLIDGLLALYELTFDPHWLAQARRLVDGMLDLFWEEKEGAFYDTGRDHESLVVRPQELFDNATPCGSSVATEVLLHMALLTGEESYKRRASATLQSMGPLLPQYALGMGRWLAALDLYLHQPKEIAIIGPREDPATRDLLEVVYSRYLPNRVVAGTEEEDLMGSHELPLLRYRTKIDGRPTAYVCENYVCQLPVTEPEALAKQLEG